MSKDLYPVQAWPICVFPNSIIFYRLSRLFPEYKLRATLVVTRIGEERSLRIGGYPKMTVEENLGLI